MSVFSSKLYQAIPFVGREKEICRNGYIKISAFLKSIGNNGFRVPYVEEMENFLAKKAEGIPCRILLVTDKEYVAATAAAYINDYLYAEEEWDEDGILYEEEEETERKVRMIPLQQCINAEKSAVNKYVTCLTEVEPSDVVLFTGLAGGEERQEKLEAVEACQAMVKCIQISPQNLKDAWVQGLLMEQYYYPLVFSELKQDYYEEVLKYLLKGEQYRLDRSISTKLLVRKMSKRRGIRFSEGDIAWYLDKAVESAKVKHPQSKVLKETDFEQLSLGEKKPMEVLQEMVGVQAVKQTALEIAALVREGLSNQKLGNLHKNMLFVGNPGTGKTTCAKLMADIMAEEGENNTNFVVAGRKDLIGEYVGHTAHKVANKFEEAKGGVLFVDEAGFFLNSSAGGYVTEAMKEFVRYMEMYPEVTVIFAMYPQEAKQFLELDEGLSSRISRFVAFEDYSNEELGSIAAHMWNQMGYKVEQEALEQVEQCMEQLRKGNKKRFGNAREVRKLVEATITAVSLRNYYTKESRHLITALDVEEGWKRLAQEGVEARKVFGFGIRQLQ